MEPQMPRHIRMAGSHPSRLRWLSLGFVPGRRHDRGGESITMNLYLVREQSAITPPASTANNDSQELAIANSYGCSEDVNSPRYLLGNEVPFGHRRSFKVPAQLKAYESTPSRRIPVDLTA